MKIPFTVELNGKIYDCYRTVEKIDKQSCMQEITVIGIGSQNDTSSYWYEDGYTQEKMESWANILAKRIINARKPDSDSVV